MNKNNTILFLADINSVHTQRWAKNVLLRGYQLSLFSLSEKKTNWIDDYPQVKWKCFGVNQETIQSSKKFGKLAYFKAIKEVRDFAAEVKPSIVHAHYASSYGMLMTAMKHPVKVLSLWGSDVYEFPKRSWLHKFLFKRIVKKATTVCSTSNDMAREAKQYVDRNYWITPFGIDTKRFIEGNNNDNQQMFTVGTVKSLEPVYGIDRLLRMYTQFQTQYEGASELVIYGKGSQEDELRKLSKELGIEANVQFKGFVSGEDLVKAFQSLDVFVALSRQESFGVAVLEAQACGTPVIVTNVGGLPEVTSPESGCIIEEDELEKGVERLVELAASSNLKSLQEQTRGFVLHRYSNEVCTENMIRMYESH